MFFLLCGFKSIYVAMQYTHQVERRMDVDAAKKAVDHALEGIDAALCRGVASETADHKSVPYSVPSSIALQYNSNNEYGWVNGYQCPLH